MPNAKIFFNGAWHELPGQKVYQNGAWITIPASGKIRFNGKWIDLHSHAWTYGESNDTCTICGITKTHNHDWNNQTGTCTTCGKACSHPQWNYGQEYNTCRTCGYQEAHTHKWGSDYPDGTRMCSLCYKVCYHSRWDITPEYNTCKDCGHKEKHTHYWMPSSDTGSTAPLNEHHCINCGTVGTHTCNEYGICSVCGYVCGHDNSDDGTCSICGLTKSTRLLLKRIAKPYTVILNGTQHEVAAGDGYVIVEPQVGDNTFQIVQAVSGYQFSGFLKLGMAGAAGSAPKVIEPITVTFEKNRQAIFKLSLD